MYVSSKGTVHARGRLMPNEVVERRLSDAAETEFALPTKLKEFDFQEESHKIQV